MNSYKAHAFAREHHLTYRTVKVWPGRNQWNRWHFEIEIRHKTTGKTLLFQWSPAPGWGYDDCRRPSIARTWDAVMCWYGNCLDVADPRFPPHSEEGREMLQDWRQFKRLFTRSEQKWLSMSVQQIDIEE